MNKTIEINWWAYLIALFLATGCGIPPIDDGSNDNQSTQVTVVRCQKYIFDRDFIYRLARFPNGDVDTYCEVGAYRGSERLPKSHRFAGEGVCFVDADKYSFEFLTDATDHVPQAILESEDVDIFSTRMANLGMDAVVFSSLDCDVTTEDRENWQRERVR